MKQIAKQVLQGLKSIAEETGKEAVKQSGLMVTETISPQELLGDIKPLSQEELIKEQAEERQRQAEVVKLQSQLKGRDVEAEIEAVREEKEKEKEEEERYLTQVKEERDRTRAQEAAAAAAMMTESSNPHKQKQKRGSAFMPQKKKASQADMSETAEYFKKAE